MELLISVGFKSVRDDELRYASPLIAAECGLSGAVLLQNIHLGLRQPTYEIYDVPWLEKTYEQFSEDSNLSQRTVRRAMQKLENIGLIQSARMRQQRWNQTKSYTIGYERLCEFLKDLYAHDYPGRAIEITFESKYQKIKVSKRENLN